MSDNRWVPTLGFELARFDDKYHVMRRGGLHVRSFIPDDEVSLRTVAVAVDYDEAVLVLRALRSGAITANTEDE